MKQDGKENMLTLWNAQNWCCMAERKKNVLFEEHRDIVCATATGKFPGKKGNKLNPKNALICCSPQWGQKCWEGKGLQEYTLILYQI